MFQGHDPMCKRRKRTNAVFMSYARGHSQLCRSSAYADYVAKALFTFATTIEVNKWQTMDCLVKVLVFAK